MVHGTYRTVARHCTASFTAKDVPASKRRRRRLGIGSCGTSADRYGIEKRGPENPGLCSELLSGSSTAQLDPDLANEVSAAGSRHIFLRRARAHPGPDRVGAAER